MNKPLVTIITPAYNCEKYITETINSVLDNGYENCEYIVIDDGSTDKTYEIIKQFQGRYPKIMSYAHKNIGEHKTVNKGLSLVNGKYFMITNADDPLLPGAIQHLVDFMEAQPDVLCAYPDWKVIDEDGNTRTHIKVRDYDFAYMVRHHTCLPSVGSIFRSDLIKLIGYRNVSFKWVSDFDYWLRIGLVGKMARVPLELATWRKHDTQLSGDKNDKRAREHIRIIQKFYSLPDIPDSILNVKREAICWSYIVAASVTNSKFNVIKYLLKALKVYPQIFIKFEFWDALIRRAIYILWR